MFDWKTVVISLFSSTTIVAILIYILKKSFDKSIDFKFSQVENKNKLELEELKRRQSIIFDKIFEAEKKLLSAVYESRNLVKYEILKLVDENRINEVHEVISQLEVRERVISDILVKERIILEESIFELSHSFKHAIASLHILFRRYSAAPDTRSEFIDKIKQIINKIDSIYEDLTVAIKKHYENSII